MTLRFDKFKFRELFFSKRVMGAGAYIHMRPDFREAGMIEVLRRRRGFLPTFYGQPWRLVQVLSPGVLRNLSNYRKRADKAGVVDGYVNLQQTPEYMSVNTVVPTLLQGSMVYSLAQGVVFEYPEHLVAMGISHELLDVGGVEGFLGKIGPASVELPDGHGRVTARQVRCLCGNGMHLSAVGSCLLFALGQRRESASHVQPPT